MSLANQRAQEEILRNQEETQRAQAEAKRNQDENQRNQVYRHALLLAAELFEGHFAGLVTTYRKDPEYERRMQQARSGFARKGDDQGGAAGREIRPPPVQEPPGNATGKSGGDQPGSGGAGSGAGGAGSGAGGAGSGAGGTGSGAGGRNLIDDVVAQWSDWFVTIEGFGGMLAQVRKEDPQGYFDSIGLMRSHIVTLAIWSVLLPDRRGEQAQDIYRTALDIADRLSGRDLDTDTARKGSDALWVIAGLLEDESQFDLALEARRKSIVLVGSFGFAKLDEFVAPLVNRLNRMAPKAKSPATRLGYYATALDLAIRGLTEMQDGLLIHQAYFLADPIFENLDGSREEREKALAGADTILARLNDKDVAKIVMPENAIAPGDLLIYLKGNALKRKAAALRGLDRLPEARAALERAIAGIASAKERDHTLIARLSGEVENDLGYILTDLSKQQEEGSAQKKEIVAEAVTHFENAKQSAFRLRIRQYNETNRELAANRVVRLAGVYRYDARDQVKARQNYELGANLRRWLVIPDQEAEAKKYDNAYARRNFAIALRFLGSWEYRYGSKLDGVRLHRECAETVEKLAESTKRGIDQEAVARCYMGLSTALRRLKKDEAGSPTLVAAADASRTAIVFLDRAEAGGRADMPLDTGYYGLASALTLGGIIGEAADTAWNKNLEYVLRGLAKAREAYSKDMSNSNIDDLAQSLDQAAFGSLLARKTDDAVRYSNELVALERPGKRLRENLAHVYTFAGRIDEAKEMYRKMIRLDRGYYEDIKEDYALFRGRGLGLPIMDEIEKELDALCSQMVCLAGTPR